MINSGDSSSDIAQFICSKEKKWLEDFGVDDIVINGIFPAEYHYTLIHSAHIGRFSSSLCKSQCYLRHLREESDVAKTEMSFSKRVRQAYLAN